MTMGLKDFVAAHKPVKSFLHVWNSGTGVWDAWSGAITTGDIEIGAVELKNATTDQRATINGSAELLVKDTTADGLLATIDADTSTLALHPYSIKQAPIEATGSAALATTVAPSPVGAWEFIGMTLHLSAVGASGTLTATVDGATASYDPVLLSQDMTAIADLSWFPAVPIPFKSGDELDFAWANAGAKTYYLTVWYARRYGDVA